MSRYYCKNCGSVVSELYADFQEYTCQYCGFAYQKLPGYETVAQWETRTGREYPDTAPVYARIIKYDGRHGDWQLLPFPALLSSSLDLEVIVATEAGAPPNGWRAK